MFAMAGMVVTEIKTPISAPDLAEVSDSTPAVPARYATKNEKKSGLEMNSVKRAHLAWAVRIDAGPLEEERPGDGRHDRGRDAYGQRGGGASGKVATPLDDRHAKP